MTNRMQLLNDIEEVFNKHNVPVEPGLVSFFYQLNAENNRLVRKFNFGGVPFCTAFELAIDELVIANRCHKEPDKKSLFPQLKAMTALTRAGLLIALASAFLNSPASKSLQ